MPAVSIFTTWPLPSTRAPSDSRTLMVVLMSRRNGTLLIWLIPGARMVATKIGSEAFLEPLTVTWPFSFFPPLMISLSKRIPLLFLGPEKRATCINEIPTYYLMGRLLSKEKWQQYEGDSDFQTYLSRSASTKSIDPRIARKS